MKIKLSHFLLPLMSLGLLTSCGKNSSDANPSGDDSKLVINFTHPSKNANSRISSLIMHYTVFDYQEFLDILTGNTESNYEASAHYLVPDKFEQEYYYNIDLLVKEYERSWHAGVSYWRNRTGINDSSIGIEIVNKGFTVDPDTKEKTWYPFPAEQIDAVILLTKDILSRYKINPACIVGHADIAPDRKQDPGVLFPWETFYKNGIGAWYDKVEVANKLADPTFNVPDPSVWKKELNDWGYKVCDESVKMCSKRNEQNVIEKVFDNELDTQSTAAVTAFQMHFRNKNYDGVMDKETYAILLSLIKKYGVKSCEGFNLKPE